MTGQSTRQQRRFAVRLALTLRVRRGGRPQELSCFATTLSRGGLFAELTPTLAKGCQVELSLGPHPGPDASAIELSGEVVAVTKDVGMAIRFKGLDQTKRRELGALLAAVARDGEPQGTPGT